jgi:hypothetical protein
LRLDVLALWIATGNEKWVMCEWNDQFNQHVQDQLEWRKAAFSEIEKLLWSDGVKPAESDLLVHLRQGLKLG